MLEAKANGQTVFLGSQPLWMLPIAGLAGLCAAATVLLAGRDLGASLLAGKDTAAPRTGMLGSPALLGPRLTWAVTASWLTDGYLDNLLVRSVSRARWLSARAFVIFAAVAAAGLLGGAGFWAGAATQHAGLTFGELLLAGLNAAAPAALLLGIGLLAFGFAPRLTSAVC